jgi:hypothetical protein
MTENALWLRVSFPVSPSEHPPSERPAPAGNTHRASLRSRERLRADEQKFAMSIFFALVKLATTRDRRGSFVEARAARLAPRQEAQRELQVHECPRVAGHLHLASG